MRGAQSDQEVNLVNLRIWFKKSTNTIKWKMHIFQLNCFNLLLHRCVIIIQNSDESAKMLFRIIRKLFYYSNQTGKLVDRFLTTYSQSLHISMINWNTKTTNHSTRDREAPHVAWKLVVRHVLVPLPSLYTSLLTKFDIITW